MSSGGAAGRLDDAGCEFVALEGRHEVDALGPWPDFFDEFGGDAESFVRGGGAGLFEAVEDGVGDGDAGDLVVEEAGVAEADGGEDADEEWGEGAEGVSAVVEEGAGFGGVVDGLGEEEIGAGLEFGLEGAEFVVGV